MQRTIGPHARPLPTRLAAHLQLPEPLALTRAGLAWDYLLHGRLGVYLWLSRHIPSWTRGAEAAALARRAYELDGRAPLLVEVGSFLGASAVLLAGARRLRGRGVVHCVDSFDGRGDPFSAPIYREILAGLGTPARRAFDQNLRRARLTDWVRVHQGRAEEVGARWDQPIDLLFLDGDQSYGAARAAFLTGSAHLRAGGLLAVHNSLSTDPHHDGARRVVAELVRWPDYARAEVVGSTTFALKAAR
jgi:predicted O-methyltransferase YrrM